MHQSPGNTKLHGFVEPFQEVHERMIQLKFPFLKSWSFFWGGKYIDIDTYRKSIKWHVFPTYFRRFPPPTFTGPSTFGSILISIVESRIWPSQQKFFWRYVFPMCHETFGKGKPPGFQHVTIFDARKCVKNQQKPARHQWFCGVCSFF